MSAIIVVCSECGAKSRIPDIKQHLGPKCGKCKAALEIKEHVVPVELSDAIMDGFIKSEKLPVLVDFFSPTCGPCSTLAPVLRNLSKKHFGKMLVCTVDTSKNPGCAAYYKIKGVPTLVFFKNGEILEQITGLPDVNVLESKMQYFTSK